ncbi:MAG: asparagine synthase [Candidatus Methanoplasma sp.]|jgi:asparagine synthase (glutamine-hydrolysing)|nr:asparagine synthase [Candidatus Methanoplasma sp.]
MTGDLGPVGEALDRAIREAVSGKEVAVAFSGGLDSGTVAAITKKYADEATLYTVGSEGSHDVTESERSAKELGMPWVCIKITEGDIEEGLAEMIGITGTADIVTLSFELPLFFVCRNCGEDEIIGGQGADELFAGYSKYIGLDGDELGEKMREDMDKLRNITLPHEKKVSEHFGKKILYPFLDDSAVMAAAYANANMPAPTGDPLSRKRAVRDIAEAMGYEGIASMEKKAAQYGSGVMPMIKKICKKRNMTYSELIDALGRGDR